MQFNNCFKKVLSLSISIGVFCAFNTPINAKPKNVIIIRHAEKIPGENHLDLKGYERAEALAYYFSGTPKYNNPPPKYIFSQGLEQADASVRPIETCSPIAKHYELPLNIEYNRTQGEALAHELLTNPKYNNSTVLICWSHHKIPSLMTALGADNPGPWPSNIFDQVYFLSYDGGSKPKLEVILQKLMFGDRSKLSDEAPPLPPSSKKRTDQD